MKHNNEMKGKNLFLGGVILTAILMQCSLLLDIDWFQYSKTEVNNGQWWRFITGNFIHLNWRHLILNILAMSAILYLFPKLLTSQEKLLILLLCGLSVTMGIWLFSPYIHWYVGLSGALHGLLVVLVILDIIQSKSMLSIGLLLLLIVKLFWESKIGPLPGSELTVGGNVMVEAHLFGSLGGLILTIVFIFKSFAIHKNMGI